MADNPFNQSSNPFESPVEAKPVDGAQSLPPVAPGGLTPILVICLILGVMGFFGSCLGGGMALVMPMFAEAMQNSELPDDQKAILATTMGAQKSVLIPVLIQCGINLIVAPMLVIGCIGCFKRKEASRNFLRLGLLAAIFYSIVKIGISIYAHLASTAAMKAAIEKLQSDPNLQGVGDTLAGSQWQGLIGTIVGIVFAIGLMAFYVWARSYMGKSQVIQYFADATNYQKA